MKNNRKSQSGKLNSFDFSSQKDYIPQFTSIRMRGERKASDHRYSMFQQSSIFCMRAHAQTNFEPTYLILNNNGYSSFLGKWLLSWALTHTVKKKIFHGFRLFPFYFHTFLLFCMRASKQMIVIVIVININALELELYFYNS